MYDMTGMSKVDRFGSMLRGIEVVRAIDLEIHTRTRTSWPFATNEGFTSQPKSNRSDFGVGLLYEQETLSSFFLSKRTALMIPSLNCRVCVGIHCSAANLESESSPLRLLPSMLTDVCLKLWPGLRISAG
jgi:hypothetical protein